MLPKAEDVDLGKGFNPWGQHRKIKPTETAHLVEEELAMVRYVHEHGPIKLWKLINALGRILADGPHKYQTRSQRQILIPLATRLCSEKKLKRIRSSNTITIGEEAPTIPYPDIAEAEIQGVHGTIRDVTGLSRLDEE